MKTNLHRSFQIFMFNKEYNKNHTEELRKKLKDAYYNVPEHNRRYLLGDMDAKDSPIRSIIEDK